MAGRRRKQFKPYIGQLETARQLIRHRNIMLGLPITKLSIATCPYGYEQDPDDEHMLRPVQKELEALYFARILKSRSTYAQLAEWITKETGRPITKDSVRCLMRYRPPLSAYILTLDERIQIATCPTEEKAIALDPRHIEWNQRKNSKARTEYRKAREAFARRTEEARRLKRAEQEERQ